MANVGSVYKTIDQLNLMEGLSHTLIIQDIYSSKDIHDLLRYCSERGDIKLIVK